jgi:hypothetical protein
MIVLRLFKAKLTESNGYTWWTYVGADSIEDAISLLLEHATAPTEVSHIRAMTLTVQVQG